LGDCQGFASRLQLPQGSFRFASLALRISRYLFGYGTLD